VVKPDVTAPGNSIISAAVGSGNGRANFSGSSMAAPHIAGIAALVMRQHPTWTVEQIKAAVMNTAVHDLYTGPNRSGDAYGPNRVGAGRTDARYAASTVVLAYSKTKPGVVSASFGVVEAPITAKKITKTQRVTVQNKAFSSRRVTLRYSPVVKQPGVSYAVTPKRLTLRARSKATVKITMTVKPAALRRTLDPTMSPTTVSDVTGLPGPRQFVSDASGHLLVRPAGKTALRVPVYGAAKPVSATTVSAGTAGGAKVLAVSGKGFSQGSGSSAFQSRGSALALGATSRKLPTCAPRQVDNCVLNGTARAMDLQFTGLGSIPSEDGVPGIGWFGFSTWGNWSTVAVGAGEVDFAIDTDNDDEPDYYVVYWASGVDRPRSVVFDGDGLPLAQYPINFHEASTDTGAYDTNVATLPFLLSDIGVPRDATSFPIRYQAVSFSGYGNPDTGLVDSTGWVPADLGKPAVRVGVPLFADRNGTTVPYTLATTSPAVPVRALILHLQGRSGQRAQVLTLR
jgi:hypothetical protein